MPSRLIITRAGWVFLVKGLHQNTTDKPARPDTRHEATMTSYDAGRRWQHLWRDTNSHNALAGGAQDSSETPQTHTDQCRNIPQRCYLITQLGLLRSVLFFSVGPSPDYALDLSVRS